MCLLLVNHRSSMSAYLVQYYIGLFVLCWPSGDSNRIRCFYCIQSMHGLSVCDNNIKWPQRDLSVPQFCTLFSRSTFVLSSPHLSSAPPKRRCNRSRCSSTLFSDSSSSHIHYDNRCRHRDAASNLIFFVEKQQLVYDITYHRSGSVNYVSQYNLNENSMRNARRQ